MRLFRVFLLIVLACCYGVWAQNVTTVSEFYERVASYATATTNVEIVVGQNLTLNQLVDIPANTSGAMLTIRSANPAMPVILKRGVSGDLFKVQTNATLILGDIIVDGDSDGDFEDGGGSLIIAFLGGTFTVKDDMGGGSFTMKDGAIVRNNNNTGGAVYISGGTFTMLGGTISGNTSSIGGGGVFVLSGAFTMSSGTISGNTAISRYGGGVHIFGGTFTMSGGTISGNTANYGGGGICVDRATFTMSGGTISGNTANSGSGVYISEGTFTMLGGTISGNTSSNGGGAVSTGANGGTFTMLDGTISGNTANYGGGVYIHVGTFTMSGGTISSNTASSGGGVSARIFTMSGGTISGNTANYGGGVNVFSGAQDVPGHIFTMSGGTISGNTASRDGGGVYVQSDNADFTLGGMAVIRDNTARNITNNVYLNNNGYITLDAPAIGMNVGITKTSNNGLFVKSGATGVYAQYFHDDAEDRGIFFYNGALMAGGSYLHYQVEAFTIAQSDVAIELEQDITLERLVNIPSTGRTLVIRSANLAKPVTLKRGTIGNLFAVSSNVTLILENIIVDGDSDGDFQDGGGSLIRVMGGIFTMKDGVIVRNNGSSGVSVSSGVFTMSGGTISGNNGSGVSISEGTFIMLGGTISGNSSNSNGGGVYVFRGTFTMSGGTISSNTASSGGGVYVISSTAFTMSGGTISGNTAARYGGGGVHIGCATFTMSGGAISGNNTKSGAANIIVERSCGSFTILGGIVAESGISVEGPYNLNNGTPENPNNGIIITWNKPSGTGPFVYTEGTKTNLTTLPTENITAVWGINDDKFGISYKNGNNEGFIEIVDATVMTAKDAEEACIADGKVWEDNKCITSIRLPQIITSNKSTQIYNGINLQATDNAVVEVYGLKGNLISRQNFGSGVYTMSLGHLPKGLYVVNVRFGSEKQVLRVMVR